MSILSKEAVAECEIILNKTNIALARSRKLIQSWIASPSTLQEDEDDEDFKPESETAGVGSLVNQQDDSAIAAVRRRQGNDKLLEQILGKKAAQAHKKSQEAASRLKPMQGLAKSEIKPGVKPSVKPQFDSEDEDESRASTLAHSKARRPEQKTTRSLPPEQSENHIPEANQQADGESSVSILKQTPQDKPTSKRKANSYLDELLNKKARKKERRK